MRPACLLEIFLLFTLTYLILKLRILVDLIVINMMKKIVDLMNLKQRSTFLRK